MQESGGKGEVYGIERGERLENKQDGI